MCEDIINYQRRSHTLLHIDLLNALDGNNSSLFNLTQVGILKRQQISERGEGNVQDSPESARSWSTSKTFISPRVHQIQLKHQVEGLPTIL